MPSPEFHLKDLAPFARGGRRACYVHPAEPSYCLKVALPGSSPGELKRRDPWWKCLRSSRHYDENSRDLKLIRAAFRRLGPLASTHLPEVRGIVQTDLGPALQTELIRDDDGRISLSAKEYIYRHGADSALRDALQLLEAFLLEHRLPLRDPFPHNIALRRNKDGSLTAKIIDGLGTAGLFSCVQVLPKVARRRIRKKIARLRLGVERADENRRNGVKPKAKGILLSS